MKKLITYFALFTFPFFLKAQINNLQLPVSINADGNDPDSSAILDVQSTDKGMLVPRMTTAQRTAISNPATGLLVFDNETGSFWYFDGSIWTELISGSPSSLSDADGDTKIQVEETADEDIIRFDLAGTEHFVMHGPRLQVVNSGNSVLIGEGAGANDDLGNNDNVLIGRNAGYNNTSGNNNVAVGDLALYNNTTGYANTAVGSEALFSHTSGEGNSAFGKGTLYSLTSGFDNSAYGYLSLIFNTTGSRNTALGTSTLRNNVIGDNNVAIGYQAGRASLGSGNVFLGTQAGYDETGSNKLYIANSSTPLPLIYGDFASNALTINGSLRINDSTQNNGYVLTSDANGNASWQSSAVVFDTLSGVVLPGSAVDIATDDFVFGSPQLNDDGIGAHDNRFFFDKSKGAFRAGRGVFSFWNESNLGMYSFSAGSNNIASGDYSTAIGGGSLASGDYSTAMGIGTYAPSAYETTIGAFSTDYTPGSTTGWNATDRIFTIGRGQNDITRLNAMVVLKNGNVGLGNSTPPSKLTVDTGDVYITNIGSGVIMKSPDGSCWRVTIDNSGNFSSTSITCP